MKILQWYKESWTQVERYLNTDIYSGLSHEEAHSRLRLTMGENSYRLKISNFKNTFLKEISILWILNNIIIISLLFYFDLILPAIYICISAFISLIIKLHRIYLSQRDFISIYKLDNSITTVIRQGVNKNIKIKELVVGDIVPIKKNCVIPADLRICEANGLKLNEKQITGQEASAEKYETKIMEEVSSLKEIINIAFKGTMVLEGEGLGIVVEKGSDTELGKIIEAFNKSTYKSRSLESSIESIFNYIETFIILVSISVFLWLFRKGILYENIQIAAIPLICIASIPTAISIFFFAFFMKKSYKEREIEIKDFSVINKIKDIDALLIDKVGSLSRDEMFAKEIFIDENLSGVYDFNSDNYTFMRLMEIAVLCNDAFYDVHNNSGKGSIQERALLRLAAGKFIYKGAMQGKYKRIVELPYDPDKRIKTTVNKVEENYRINIKGAVDYIIENCNYFMKDGIEKELTSKEIEEIKAADYSMSSRGLFTIAFAYRNFNYEPRITENLESNLVFVGIIGMENPIKSEALKNISVLKGYNIETEFITEDNKITAGAVGLKLGIINKPSQVISGVEMNHLSKDEFKKLVEEAKVYARINSEHRVKVVKALKDNGINIAVTGEKVSDLPALGSSHIGISIGDSCSINLRKQSDVYIKKNYLESFIYFVHKGRQDYTALRRMVELSFFAFIMEVLLMYLYSLYDIYIMNIIIIPLAAVNCVINNKRIHSKYEKMGISDFLSRGFIINTVSYFLFYTLSYYYTKEVLGFLYLETTAFLFSTSVLLKSFDFSILYNKLWVKRILYISAAVL